MIHYIVKQKHTNLNIFLGVAIDEVRGIFFVSFQTGLYQNLFTLEAWIPSQYIFRTCERDNHWGVYYNRCEFTDLFLSQQYYLNT